MVTFIDTRKSYTVDKKHLEGSGSILIHFIHNPQQSFVIVL